MSDTPHEKPRVAAPASIVAPIRSDWYAPRNASLRPTPPEATMHHSPRAPDTPAPARRLWSLAAVSATLLVAGAVIGGLEGGIGALLVVLVVAINQLDVIRSAPTDHRFVPETMLLARPSVGVHRGWDVVRRKPCLMVLVDAGPHAHERAGAVTAERAFRSLRSGPRYAEGVTGEGRLLWAFELAGPDRRRVTLIDRTPLAG